MQKGLQNDLNTQDNLFFKAQKVKPEKKKRSLMPIGITVNHALRYVDT